MPRSPNIPSHDKDKNKTKNKNNSNKNNNTIQAACLAKSNTNNDVFQHDSFNNLTNDDYTTMPNKRNLSDSSNSSSPDNSQHKIKIKNY
jgi:hypothetical protein